MSTNSSRMQKLIKQQEIARRLYFEKYPDNGKTVRSYWEKCRVMAAKEAGLL